MNLLYVEISGKKELKGVEKCLKMKNRINADKVEKCFEIYRKLKNFDKLKYMWKNMQKLLKVENDAKVEHFKKFKKDQINVMKY